MLCSRVKADFAISNYSQHTESTVSKRLVTIRHSALLWATAPRESMTYVDDAAERGLFLTKFVLAGQVAQKKQLLVDSFVLGRGNLRIRALGAPDLRLGHFTN